VLQDYFSFVSILVFGFVFFVLFLGSIPLFSLLYLFGVWGAFIKKAAAGGSGFSNSYSLSFTQRSLLQDFSTSYNTYCTLLDSFFLFCKNKYNNRKR